MHRGPFGGVPAPSRRGAFGLLYRGGLEKVSELAVDPSPLHGRGLRHRSDKHRCCRDVLASAFEDRGLLAPYVIVDAVVDVTSPPPGYSTITVTPLLLLEGVSELLQKESVLFDLGLKFVELLQV